MVGVAWTLTSAGSGLGLLGVWGRGYVLSSLLPWRTTCQLLTTRFGCWCGSVGKHWKDEDESCSRADRILFLLPETGLRWWKMALAFLRIGHCRFVHCYFLQKNRGPTAMIVPFLCGEARSRGVSLLEGFLSHHSSSSMLGQGYCQWGCGLSPFLSAVGLLAQQPSNPNMRSLKY